jgi:hypothetical protein
MNRRHFAAGIATMPAAHSLSAQQAATPRATRIGILGTRSPRLASEMNDALIEGLRDHGYIEGRNLVVEDRTLMQQPRNWKRAVQARFRTSCGACCAD